jgi:hypothetical protein
MRPWLPARGDCAIEMIQVKNCALKAAKMQRGGTESDLWWIGTLQNHDKT